MKKRPKKPRKKPNVDPMMVAILRGWMRIPLAEQRKLLRRKRRIKI